MIAHLPINKLLSRLLYEIHFLFCLGSFNLIGMRR